MAGSIWSLLALGLALLIQLTVSKNIPHDKCPENSYVAGLSLGLDSETRAVRSLRLHCTRPHVLSEYKKNVFVQLDLDEGQVGTEWTKPWFCKRGIATGIQLQSGQGAPDGLRLICSDSSAPESGKDQEWSDWKTCEAQEALCALEATQDGAETNGKLAPLGLQCCAIPHPASTCQTSDKWREVGECVNKDAAVTKTCVYESLHGLSYAGKDDERNIYEDLGFTLASAGPYLAAKPEFQLQTAEYDWSGSSDQTWSLETRVQDSMSAEPGFRIRVYQVLGHCGFYKVRTPFFKTEAERIHHSKPAHTHHEKPLHKRVDDDLEGMQADWPEADSDSWEDAEEEVVAVVPENKVEAPVPKEDSWEDEDAQEPVKLPEVKDDSWEESGDEEKKPEAAVEEKKQSAEEEDAWSDEVEVKETESVVPVKPTEEIKTEPTQEAEDAEDWSAEGSETQDTVHVPIPTSNTVVQTKPVEEAKVEPITLSAEDVDDWSVENSETQDSVHVPVPTSNTVLQTKPVEEAKVEPTLSSEDGDDWSAEGSETQDTVHVPIPTSNTVLQTKPAEEAKVEPTLSSEDGDDWSAEGSETQDTAHVPIPTSNTVVQTKPAEEPKVEPTLMSSEDGDDWGAESLELQEPVPTVVVQPEVLKVEPTVKVTEEDAEDWSAESVESQDPVQVVPELKPEPEVTAQLVNEPRPSADVAESEEDWGDSEEVKPVAAAESEAEVKSVAAAESEAEVKQEEAVVELVPESAPTAERHSNELEDEFSAEHDLLNDPFENAAKHRPVQPETERESLENYDGHHKIETGTKVLEPVESEDSELFEFVDVSKKAEAKMSDKYSAALKQADNEEQMSQDVPEESWESSFESSEDAGSPVVEPASEIKVPILSAPVESPRRAFGMLKVSEDSVDSPPAFDIGTLPEKAKGFAAGASDLADQISVGASDFIDDSKKMFNEGKAKELADQFQSGASDLADQFLASGFVDESKKVFNEVKEMPIVQDIQKNVEEAVKTGLDSVLGQPAGVAEVTVDESARSEDLQTADAEASNAEGTPQVAKAGGYIGYIVGGMVVAVIIIVIVIFVIEKRQTGNPEPQPKEIKRDYVDTYPPPEPLLGNKDQKIVIEAE